MRLRANYTADEVCTIAETVKDQHKSFRTAIEYESGLSFRNDVDCDRGQITFISEATPVTHFENALLIKATNNGTTLSITSYGRFVPTGSRRRDRDTERNLAEYILRAIEKAEQATSDQDAAAAGGTD